MSTESTASTGDTTGTGDIADLSYEQARDELVAIVSRIEGGNASLEESMELWERGEALAAHCQAKLDQAQDQLDRGAAASAETAETADRTDSDQTNSDQTDSDQTDSDQTDSDAHA